MPFLLIVALFSYEIFLGPLYIGKNGTDGIPGRPGGHGVRGSPGIPGSKGIVSFCCVIAAILK